MNLRFRMGRPFRSILILSALSFACTCDAAQINKPTKIVPKPRVLPKGSVVGLQDSCTATHPLQPLTQSELAAISSAVQSYPNFKKNGPLVFASVALKEPDKNAVYSFQSGQSFDRTAEVILFNNSTNAAWDVLVSITPGCKTKVLSFVQRPTGDIPSMFYSNGFGSQMTEDEMTQLCLNNAAFKGYLQARGITTNFTTFKSLYTPFYYFLELSIGGNANESLCPEVSNELAGTGGRYGMLCFFKNSGADPNSNLQILGLLKGLGAIVDFTHKKIVKVISTYTGTGDGLPVTTQTAMETVPHPQLSRLCTTMPDGPSYSISADNEVTWDNWKFRITWNPLTGVQIAQARYTDDGGATYRNVLYKGDNSASLVSYGSANNLFYRNFTSYDSVSYPFVGAARTSGSQVIRLFPVVKGVDVPQYATVMGIPDLDINGTATTIPNMIGIFEQEGDVLYRGRDINGAQYGAKGRQLVVRSMFAGIVYLWTYSWIFNQDGSIEVKVDVGGQTLYDVIDPSQASSDWGQLIAPYQLAFDHNHIYNFRLDFDIDGQNNVVAEENQYVLNPQDNVCGHAVGKVETPFATVSQGVRDLNPASNRSWIVYNPSVTNRMGGNTGYQIQFNSHAALEEDYSWLKTHFGFVKHHLHVTPYSPDMLHVTGDWPLQKPTDVGLAAFVANNPNTNIYNTDVVTWCTLMFSHKPHTEDFPFVPNYTTGIKITPHDFFDFNPVYMLNNPGASVAKSTNGQVTDVCNTCNCP